MLSWDKNTDGTYEGINDGRPENLDDGDNVASTAGDEEINAMGDVDFMLGDEDGDCDGELVHALVDPKLRDVTDDKHPA